MKEIKDRVTKANKCGSRHRMRINTKLTLHNSQTKCLVQLPCRSALRLSKHSEQEDRSSVKAGSRMETGLG